MPVSVNLITRKTLYRFRTRASTRVWKSTLAISLATAVFLTIWFQSIASKRQDLIAQETSIASTPRLVASRNLQLKKELRLAEDRAHAQEVLRSSYSPLSVFALLSQIKESLDGELSVELVDFSLERSNPPAKPNSGPQRRGRLQLQLVTSSTLNSSKTIESLKASGYFQKVELSTALVKLKPESSDLRFNVACEF